LIVRRSRIGRGQFGRLAISAHVEISRNRKKKQNNNKKQKPIITGYEQVKLPEDSVLNGFTPLMVNEPDVSYAPKDLDFEVAQFALRMNKLLFFGTVFLCGLEPPVLKLEIEDDFREYVSVVCTSNSRDSPVASQDLVSESPESRRTIEIRKRKFSFFPKTTYLAKSYLCSGNISKIVFFLINVMPM
jgi:hypothetical protein